MRIKTGLKNFWNFLTKKRCPRCQRYGGVLDAKRPIGSREVPGWAEIEIEQVDRHGEYRDPIYRQVPAIIIVEEFLCSYHCIHCEHNWESMVEEESCDEGQLDLDLDEYLVSDFGVNSSRTRPARTRSMPPGNLPRDDVTGMEKDELVVHARSISKGEVSRWAKRLGIPRWQSENHAPGSRGSEGICTLGRGSCPERARFSMREDVFVKERGNRHAVCEQHMREWLPYWQDKINRGESIRPW